MAKASQPASVGSNIPEWSVSGISSAIRGTLEGAFGRVRVRGELGRVSRPISGHVYMDIKDADASLSMVAFRSVAVRLRCEPEEGLEVVATGRITAYAGKSRYQLIIEELALAGIGAMLQAIEQRRQRLAAEGLFAPERKQLLPRLPEVIGVVTSPTGSVIRDILHRLRERFPRRVIVWPAAVQGDHCPRDVVAAIAGFNACTPGGPIPRPDLLIVARGGGSVEDLVSFSDEAVVRAIAASDIPVISAIGHETDTTLADHAADMRAPTPTAAAEMAVPVRTELLAQLRTLDGRRLQAGQQVLNRARARMQYKATALPRADTLTGAHAQRLDLVESRRTAALRNRANRATNQLDRARLPTPAPWLQRKHATCTQHLQQSWKRLEREAWQTIAQRRIRLASLERLLRAQHHEEILRKGFAIVTDGERVLPRAAALHPEMDVTIQFADGCWSARTRERG